MRKVLLFLLLLLPVIICAQEIKERRIYYLDCSQSMSGIGRDAEDIWDNITSKLKDAIEDVSVSESTELIVLKFASTKVSNDNLEGLTKKATPQGKKELIDYINKIPKPDRTHPTNTYHINPINDFINRRYDSSVTTYVFFMTDGDDDGDKSLFNNKVAAWPFINNEVYSFYIMLNEKHKDGEREKIIKNTKHFWSIKTANVNVNVINPKAISRFNCRKDSCIVITFSGSIKELPLHVKGKGHIKIERQETIDNSTLKLWVKPDVENYNDLPSQFTSQFSIELSGADSEGVLVTNKTYNILVENTILADCVCQPGTNISLKNKQFSNWEASQYVLPFNIFEWAKTYSDKTLGVVKFYESSVFYPKDSTFVSENQFSFVYDDYSVKREAKASFKFIIDDRLKGSKLKIFYNNKEVTNDTISVTKGDVRLFSFWISPEVPVGEYTLSFQILNHNLMYFDGKEIPKDCIVRTWTLEHEKILNPFWVWFWRLCILLLLLAIILGLLFCYRYFRSPKFPKTPIGVRLKIDPLTTPANIQLYSPIERNSINVGKYHFHFINSIILYSDTLEKYPTKKQNWFQKKWNGEIIYIKTDFKGRNIETITLRPVKTNKKIGIVVNHECDRDSLNDIVITWNRGNFASSTRIYLSSNCYIEAYDRLVVGQVNKSKSHRFIMNKFSTLFNNNNN